MKQFLLNTRGWYAAIAEIDQDFAFYMEGLILATAIERRSDPNLLHVAYRDTFKCKWFDYEEILEPPINTLADEADDAVIPLDQPINIPPECHTRERMVLVGPDNIRFSAIVEEFGQGHRLETGLITLDMIRSIIHD